MALCLDILRGHEQWHDTIIGDVKAGTWNCTKTSIWSDLNDKTTEGNKNVVSSSDCGVALFARVCWTWVLQRLDNFICSCG